MAVDRFDAEYWQPKYQEIEQRVASVKQAELGSVVAIQKGVEAGSDAYKTEGKPFIRVSDFSIYGIDDAEKYISDDLYASLKAKYQPQAGEVLFTKDGTIGITYAMHEDYEGILSGAFLRLSPKVKLDIDYLALALNSMYCKSQIERMSGGAIIAHLKPDDAKRIKIPILSEAKQQEISREVSTALRLMNDSRKLLDEARHAVETFVEQDEKAAFDILP
jgi:type I restriction enzyme S subunit